MSWALKNLSYQVRESIARSSFVVKDRRGWELYGECPGHDDKGSAFGYNVLKDVGYCFDGCGQRGDLIDLWGFNQGYFERDEAVDAFLAEFGDGSIPIEHSGFESTMPDESTEVSISEIEFMNLVEVHEFHMDILTERYGWSYDAVRCVGLRIYKIDGIPWVCFPLRDEDNRLIDVRLLNPDGASDILRSWTGVLSRPRIYPDHVSISSVNPLIICRDEISCITARSYGFNACTQACALKDWDLDVYVKRLAGRDIVAAVGGNSSDGQKLSEKIAGKMTSRCPRGRAIHWPNFMEPDEGLVDWFVKYKKNADDFTALIASARSC